MRTFTLGQGAQRKYVVIDVQGTRMSVTHGKADAAPTRQDKTLAGEAEVKKAVDLMVKELEAAAAPPLTVAIDLSCGGEQAELVASWAAGVAIGAIDAGVPVTLLTAEREGPVTAPVSTRVEIGRRLARATDGRTGPAPAGASRVVVVDEHGIRW